MGWMSRILFWTILLATLVYAAMLVRDGQATLFGPLPQVVKTFLEQLPLPASRSPAPAPREEAAAPSDPRLLRRLTQLESAEARQQADLQQLRTAELAPLAGAIAELHAQLATLPKTQYRPTMETGSVKVRWDDSGWRLEDYFAKRRLWNQRVTFATPFAISPRMALGMTRLETGPEGSVEIQATDVDEKGFTLVLQAEEGRPREVKAQWLAFGEPAL